MNMNTSSPGVREPLYPHQEDRRRTEDEEEMDIIITKIQEDQTYRSSSRLVRIIQVLYILLYNSSFTSLPPGHSRSVALLDHNVGPNHCRLDRLPLCVLLRLQVPHKHELIN